MTQISRLNSSKKQNQMNEMILSPGMENIKEEEEENETGGRLNISKSKKKSGNDNLRISVNSSQVPLDYSPISNNSYKDGLYFKMKQTPFNKKRTSELILTLSRQISKVKKKLTKKKKIEKEKTKDEIIDELRKVIKTQRKKINELQNENNKNLLKMKEDVKWKLNYLGRTIKKLFNLVIGKQE
jgi:hypothetical protein